MQFIIELVQNESEGFQYVVDYEITEDIHEIKFDDEIIKQVEELLWNREEVADVEVDEYGFDIVLYTDYAPNYIKEEW